MRAVDLFAGAGGFSLGARAAGVSVVWAANHWATAVDVYARNHPGPRPLCQDLRQADWTRVPAHDLLLASPACTGHTRARGPERPHHDAARSTAWAVVECAEMHRPRAVVVENVTEFMQWTLYPSWLDAMQRLGYFMHENVIDAADVGVPQNRRRLFMVGVRGRMRVDIGRPHVQHVPASTIFDVDAPDETWTRWDTLSPNTQRRCTAGRQQHGRRFLVAYYGNAQGGRSLGRPVGTLTTKVRYGLVDGDFLRMMRVHEASKGMGFPTSYVLTGSTTADHQLLGNAVPPPMAEWVIRKVLENL